MSETAIKKYAKDDIILAQGEADDGLYKILSGSIALYLNYDRPGEKLLEVISAPQCIGGVSALTGQPGYCTAVAESDAVLMQVPNDGIDGFIRNDYQTAIAIMNIMAKCIAALNSDMNRLLNDIGELAKAETVSARSLRKLASRHGAIRQEDTAVEPPKAAPAPKPPEPPKAAPAPKPPEPPRSVTTAIDSFFLPGHRNYPGITHPEYKELIFSKKISCPHCKKQFNSIRILNSKLMTASGMERYDLRPRYKDFQVEWYDIITCQHCYFSAPSHSFVEAKGLKKDKYAPQLTRLCGALHLDFEDERDIDFVFAQHYLALACAEGFLGALQLRAHLWMNIGWLYEDAGDDAMRRLAEEKAIAAYQEVYTQCRLTPTQEQRVCMMLASMLHRAGDGIAAREWAYKARVNRAGKQVYSDLAEHLIADIREEMAAAKKQEGEG